MLVKIFPKLCEWYLCSEVVAGLFRTAVVLKISQDSQDTQMIVLHQQSIPFKKRIWIWKKFLNNYSVDPDSYIIAFCKIIRKILIAESL